MFAASTAAAKSLPPSFLLVIVDGGCEDCDEGGGGAHCRGSDAVCCYFLYQFFSAVLYGFYFALFLTSQNLLPF
ncbi:hypothetical protein A2U01_0036669 [Trifolium medium]|uniref:Uncharacterized protein n=1 Tax=Trifolium medium TaxID=97028 RepID=A0A392PTW1_9FABA|nr:hypothetical protein [Trifolium medium]